MTKSCEYTLDSRCLSYTFCGSKWRFQTFEYYSLGQNKETNAINIGPITHIFLDSRNFVWLFKYFYFGKSYDMYLTSWINCSYINLNVYLLAETVLQLEVRGHNKSLVVTPADKIRIVEVLSIYCFTVCSWNENTLICF